MSCLCFRFTMVSSCLFRQHIVVWPRVTKKNGGKLQKYLVFIRHSFQFNLCPWNKVESQCQTVVQPKTHLCSLQFGLICSIQIVHVSIVFSLECNSIRVCSVQAKGVLLAYRQACQFLVVLQAGNETRILFVFLI